MAAKKKAPDTFFMTEYQFDAAYPCTAEEDLANIDDVSDGEKILEIKVLRRGELQQSVKTLVEWE